MSIIRIVSLLAWIYISAFQRVRSLSLKLLQFKHISFPNFSLGAKDISAREPGGGLGKSMCFWLREVRRVLLGACFVIAGVTVFRRTVPCSCLGTQELQRDDEGQSGAAAGSLSALFRRVVNVCQSQFVVIGQVFPPPLVAKVTRLLLQRILNDPVYGVQVRTVLMSSVSRKRIFSGFTMVIPPGRQSVEAGSSRDLVPFPDCSTK